MSRRYRGITGTQTSKGGILLGRKPGARRGDIQELTLQDLLAAGIATHQSVNSATSGLSGFVPLQNGGTLILDAAGELINVNA